MWGRHRLELCVLGQVTSLAMPFAIFLPHKGEGREMREAEDC